MCFLAGDAHWYRSYMKIAVDVIDILAKSVDDFNLAAVCKKYQRMEKRMAHD